MKLLGLYFISLIVLGFVAIHTYDLILLDLHKIGVGL